MDPARALLVVCLTWQAQRMALDPIVSLSVAIAEAPGTYAILVGSGVSRDAGVPTGSEVLWQAVGALYRLENATAETPDRGDLEDWLESTGRGEIDYSGVLEEIAPDPATRATTWPSTSRASSRATPTSAWPTWWSGGWSRCS